jgi:HTH-type transcriptional regulator / antitoxin HigA
MPAPKVIKTDAEHAAALARLMTLMKADLPADSKEESELELLAILIEHYERIRFPMAKPDPVEAIKFRMDQQGLSQKDLIPFIGSAPKVSEVLNRKRPLSLSMIRRLNEGLGIPLDLLLQEDEQPSVTVTTP